MTTAWAAGANAPISEISPQASPVPSDSTSVPAPSPSLPPQETQLDLSYAEDLQRRACTADSVSTCFGKDEGDPCGAYYESQTKQCWGTQTSAECDCLEIPQRTKDDDEQSNVITIFLDGNNSTQYESAPKVRVIWRK